MPKKEKIVLAFSGGLDTSIILKWLQNEKNLRENILDAVTYLRLLHIYLDKINGMNSALLLVIIINQIVTLMLLLVI